MCSTNAIGPRIRPLIIEVFENGKVSLPSFAPCSGEGLTIDELKACRDFIELIIDNPNNFHIVKTKEELIIANCRECRMPLGNNTEIQTGICFDCEKKKILNATRHNVGNYVSKLGPVDGCTDVPGREPRFCPFCKTQIIYTPAYNQGYCYVCTDGVTHTEAEYNNLVNLPAPVVDDLDIAMGNMPGYQINEQAGDNEAVAPEDQPSLALSMDEKICSHAGCNTIINKTSHPIRYRAGVCMQHKLKKY